MSAMDRRVIGSLQHSMTAEKQAKHIQEEVERAVRALAQQRLEIDVT